MAFLAFLQMADNQILPSSSCFSPDLSHAKVFLKRGKYGPFATVSSWAHKAPSFASPSGCLPGETSQEAFSQLCPGPHQGGLKCGDRVWKMTEYPPGLWFTLSLSTKGSYEEPGDSHLPFLCRLALGFRDK